MEDNIIEFEENGKTVKYDVILNLEDINGKNFVVYTKSNKKDKKDVICYASEYKIEKGKTTILFCKAFLHFIDGKMRWFIFLFNSKFPNIFD